MKKIISVFIFAFIILNFTGCAPTSYVKPSVPISGLPGRYHKVEKGQTLWRISKTYNVDLDELARINHISDATNIEIGQLIFIPSKLEPGQTMPDKYYSSEDFIWPLKGRVISSFGQPINNIINKGINIQSDTTDVVASRSGKVIFFSDYFAGFGKIIIIDHQDGFSTVYAMNSKLLVKAGDNLQRGATIAKASNLHFEIRKGHIPQNPMFYLP